MADERWRWVVGYEGLYMVSDAHEATGTTPSHINECCNGKRKTANGFEWRYREVI